jgi:hypothetical protein
VVDTRRIIGKKWRAKEEEGTRGRWLKKSVYWSAHQGAVNWISSHNFSILLHRLHMCIHTYMCTYVDHQVKATACYFIHALLIQVCKQRLYKSSNTIHNRPSLHS